MNTNKFYTQNCIHWIVWKRRTGKQVNFKLYHIQHHPRRCLPQRKCKQTGIHKMKSSIQIYILIMYSMSCMKRIARYDLLSLLPIYLLFLSNFLHSIAAAAAFSSCFAFPVYPLFIYAYVCVFVFFFYSFITFYLAEDHGKKENDDYLCVCMSKYVTTPVKR